MTLDEVYELLRLRGAELSLLVDLAVHVQDVHREAVGLQPASRNFTNKYKSV